MQRRSRTARATLLGNGMAWFGAAAFLLALAGEHSDVLTAGPWSRAVGFILVAAAGIGLAIVGVLDNRRIRLGRRLQQ